MATSARRRSSCDGPRQLEQLWSDLTGLPSRRRVPLAAKARPTSRSRRPLSTAVKSTTTAKGNKAASLRSGARGSGPKARGKGELLLLPLDLLRNVCDRIPAAEHLRLAHVCRQLRAGLLSPAWGSSDSFWAAVCTQHWGVAAATAGIASRELHCQQVGTVVQNAQLLCSRALRIALNVHYSCKPGSNGGRGPPQLERCDSNSGTPAVFNTRAPLGLCLLLDSTGRILGFAIFVTVRFYVQDQQRGGTQDIRNYLVVKRGQRVMEVKTGRSSSRRSTATGLPRDAWRFRIAGEHSALVQGIAEGQVGTAVVAREALVNLDPRKHSVAHALTYCCAEVAPEVETATATAAIGSAASSAESALTALQAATLAQTRRLILATLRGRKRLF